MCGIAGIIGNIDNRKSFNIKKMISILSHRGPDNQRILETTGSLLAFSRLKIIDFNDRSMQPMISQDNKFILLFNGEIYNYKELKIQIGNQYKFITSSDTEVLLAMLILYGIKSLEKINGMFAFCFYDVEKNTYTFARDRFGQKPFFYHRNNNFFYFASEIKALLVAGIDNTPDYNSISEYLHKGKIDCYENTWFKKIKQLPAGELIQIKNNLIITKFKWYDIEATRRLEIPQNTQDRNSLINDTFVKVCEEHLNSDTNIGIKLSGGLDSSTMLASMEKNKKYLSNECFSVDFGSSFSEKKWIKEASNFFNKDISIVSYNISDFINDFDKIIYKLEGPLGGLMNCAFEKIYKKANDKGLRVLLDGTGLDEAFGGYRIHHLTYLKKLLKNNSNEFNIQVKYYAEKWNVKKADVINELNNLNSNENYVQDGSSFNQKNYTTKYLQSFDEPHIHKKVKETGKIQDHFVNYLICNKIPKNTRFKDRQSMSYSIELRMPFLDHRIIELGLSLQEKHYFQDGLTKSIVRKAMKNKLPEKVRISQKRSIQAPQAQWLQNEKVSEYILDLLSSENVKNRDILNIQNVIKSYKSFLKKGSSNTFHIWQWINIENFFKIFIDKKINNFKSNNNIEYIYMKN